MQKKLFLIKWVLNAKELLTFAVNDFDVKKSVGCSRVLVVTELFVSGTQCSPFQTLERVTLITMSFRATRSQCLNSITAVDV